MNNEAVALFNQRYDAIKKEKRYYNKFIFNGHFTVFLVILLGAFILGYGQWLQHIPKYIDYAFFASIAIALTSIFPFRTFLKDADKLFLLPFEKNMNDYIKLGVRYSYFNRIILQIVLLIVLFPLFYKLNQQLVVPYIVMSVLAIIHPILGLRLKWQWYRARLSQWILNVIIFVIDNVETVNS